MTLTQHFQWYEFRCPCGCATPLSALSNIRMLAARLECLRAVVGHRPIVVTSGYRCEAHNRRVGGAPNSLHLTGRGADIKIQNQALRAVARTAQSLGFGGIGLYPSHLHVDIRDLKPTNLPARWSEVQPVWWDD